MFYAISLTTKARTVQQFGEHIPTSNRFFLRSEMIVSVLPPPEWADQVVVRWVDE